MPYIESFLLYILIIVVVFILIVTPVILIIWIISHFDFFYKRDYFKKFFLGKFEIINIRGYFTRVNIQKDLIKNILKSKFILFLFVIYFSFFGFFYIKQSFTYYGSDRSYPQAKAYAIVGNTIYLFHSILLSIKVIYPENSLDKKVIKVQDYILEKIYQYIPQEDVERDIWLYKFKYNYIVKLRYGPVIKKDKENKYRFMLMEMNQVTYLPHMLTIMNTLHNISNNLISKKIEDKVFNKKDRYLIIAQMSYYLTKKMSIYVSLNKIDYVQKVKLFLNNEKLVKKLIDYTHLLEKVYELQRDNKNVKEAFEKSPLSKAILLTSLAENLDKLLIYKVSKDIYPCDTNEMKLYVKYHKEFHSWVGSNELSYKNLSFRERKRVNSLKGMFFEDKESFYTIAKYICKIPFSYQIRAENHYDKESKKYKFTLDKKDYLLNFTSANGELFQTEKLKRQKLNKD